MLQLCVDCIGGLDNSNRTFVTALEKLKLDVNCKAWNHFRIHAFGLINRGKYVRHNMDILFRHQIETRDDQILTIIACLVARVKEIQPAEGLCTVGNLPGTEQAEPPNLSITTSGSFLIGPEKLTNS